MQIHFNDTQPARGIRPRPCTASSPTTASVLPPLQLVGSHGAGRHPRRPGRRVHRWPKHQGGEGNADAYDRYEVGDDLVIERTYGSETDARSTWTIHAVDGSHATLNIDSVDDHAVAEGPRDEAVPEENLLWHQLHPVHRGGRAPHGQGRSA